MYVFSKNNKAWTCPDSSIQEIAFIQASDRTNDKKLITDNDSAIAYLETCGFEVTHIQDIQPITDPPKSPDWYNTTHRDLYKKLLRKDFDSLTKAEQEFCKTMYHYEEASAL